MNELVFNQNGRPVTTSRLVATRFSKEHKVVLRTISNLRCHGVFHFFNFWLRDYTNSSGRKQQEYVMTCGGFSCLAQGFTGAQAARYKEEFIYDFNQMEQMLQAQ